MSLLVVGKALKTSTEIGNSIARKCEPVALRSMAYLPIPDLKPYLKKLPDSRLKLSVDNGASRDDANMSKRENDVKHLYQLRNNVLNIAAMGIYSLPFTARFFDLLTPAKNPKTAAKTETLRSFHIYASGAVSEKLCFSFAGASWLFFYEVGVAIAFQECIQAKALNECIFLGCSTGSFVAACLAMEISVSKHQDLLINAVCSVSRKFFGPIGQCSKMWEDLLQTIIKEDINLPNSKLFISLTEVASLNEKVVNEHSTKKELINHIMASCYMPLLFEKPVQIGGRLFVNGSYQRTLSTLPEYLTITISPDVGEANICPSMLRYTTLQKFFPPTEPFLCQGMIDDGIRDAKKWLSRMYNTQVLPERFFQPDFKATVFAIEDN